MMQAFPQNRLVIASHNQGKVREIADLLSPYGLNVICAGELGLPEPVEDGKTFEENAIIKARAAAAASGLAALADDSGLEVAALNGAPGIYSARWAGPDKDFAVAMARIEKELEGKDDRRARFVCVLALCWPDGAAKADGTSGSHEDLAVFRGTVEGNLIWPPRGKSGFGYDPVFVPTGKSLTFGEMPPQEKHTMSHRADAFNKLIAACF